jgi:hypothetical protein
MQRLGKHVPAATNTHATIEVPLKTVFSTRSVPRSYKEDNWCNQVSCVQESEAGIAIVRSRYQETCGNRLRTLDCVL